ncbi:MAG: hypothetical protein RI947_135 [Candidatus Parcubacteria bacterium]|jgi:mutator protein MutT
MITIASVILENEKGEILLMLRDNKPNLPFPHHWDIFGGHVEEGETPEQALVREVKEELNLDLKDYTFYRKYHCMHGDIHANVKYIYTAKLTTPIEKLTLGEGEEMRLFNREEIKTLKFANIMGNIVMDYID